MKTKIKTNKAFQLLQQDLQRKHECWFKPIFKNKERHALLIPEKDGVPTYYVLYKPSGFYNTFGSEFSHLYTREPERAKLGESINQEWLDIAIYNNADYLIFIYPKYIYYIETMIFKNYAKSRNLIRVQKKGEAVFSVPVDLLRRFD